MEPIKPVKLEIIKKESSWIIKATMSDGEVRGWSGAKTEKGAKSRLTVWAKRLDLIKSHDGLSAIKK